MHHPITDSSSCEPLVLEDIEEEQKLDSPREVLTIERALHDESDATTPELDIKFLTVLLCSNFAPFV